MHKKELNYEKNYLTYRDYQRKKKSQIQREARKKESKSILFLLI